MECNKGLRSDDATATRTSKSTIGLVDKTTAIHVHLTFLYISLPFLHDYHVKLPDYTFREDVHERRRNFILSPNSLNTVDFPQEAHVPLKEPQNNRSLSE